MEEVPEVLHVDLEVDENEPKSGILKLLRIIRPNWSTDLVHMKTFTEGMTNRLMGCFLRSEPGFDGDQDCVMVRVYGRHTDLYVDRSEEIQMIRVLETRGLGSKIYCSFRNGICYEFLQGAVLSYSQLLQREVYRLIAAQMAKLHSVSFHDSEVELKPFLWIKMEHFLNLLQTNQSETSKENDSQSDQSKEYVSQSETGKKADSQLAEKKDCIDQSENRSRSRSNLPDSESRLRSWAGPLPGPEVLRTEMNLLKSKLSPLQNPVVLCHNDLLSNNIIYNKKQGSVRFIDYEYAALNYQAFDIGNHFNEFAGLNPVDYSRYPSPGLQRDWIRTYLQNYRVQDHIQETGHEVTEQEVTRLYNHVCKFSLASNLFWGMWAILQSRLSAIDFDFKRYAAARLHFYFEKRDEYLSLEEDLDLGPGPEPGQ